MKNTIKQSKNRCDAYIRCALIAVVSAGLGSVGMAQAAAFEVPTAAIDRNAVLADSVICTVVHKAGIDAYQGLGAGNPIDSLVNMPASCTGNMLPQSQMAGGIRQMMTLGFRVINVSHQVTTLIANSSGKAELLISAMIAMERPTVVIKTR